MVIYKRSRWIDKEKLFRVYFKRVEIRKLVVKSLLYAFCYSLKEKIYFASIFLLFSKLSSRSKYRKGCMFSGYGRVIFCQFKLSRHFCKYYASHGHLLGLRKSSF